MAKPVSQAPKRLLSAATTACASALLLLAPGVSRAQQGEPIGTVVSRDATVSGGLQVQGETTRLFAHVSITAHDHPAPITLQRGGGILVCSTSEFHLVRSGSSGSLLFGLDRGAVEVLTESFAQDAVITPDLKLTPVTKGMMDLKLRVTREGDTCVDNAGAGAPVLNASDPFSSASYHILPGQHLLFVKGDLHKVVDHERSSCGCPPPGEPLPNIVAATPGQPVTPAQAAATHPFPAAESTGLAPPTAPANEAPTGTASSQVSTTFSYGEGQGPPPSVGPEPATGPTSTTSAVQPAPAEPSAQPSATGFFHKLGRFFHRLFHGDSPDTNNAPPSANSPSR